VCVSVSVYERESLMIHTLTHSYLYMYTHQYSHMHPYTHTFSHEEPQHECVHCKSKFRLKSTMKLHIRTIHDVCVCVSESIYMCVYEYV
jgi:hypothetical protein